MRIPTLESVKGWVIENFLVLSIAGSVIISFAYPYPGIVLGSYHLGGKAIVSFINICCVFFISGLTLKVDEIQSALRKTVPVVYGIFAINFFTTLTAPIFLSLTFLGYGFRLGLAIFSCVPTTLGFGIALTQLANADALLSLFLTVVTNMIGALIIPYLLQLYVNEIDYGRGDESSTFNVDASNLLFDMTLRVLVPTIVGIALRFTFATKLKKFLAEYKIYLTIFSHFSLAMMLWMALSAAREHLLQESYSSILIVLVCVLVQYFFYMLLNLTAVGRYGLNLELKQIVSLTIVSSLKSNPVLLAVTSSMDVPHSLRGLMVIPGILGQITQIFIGTFFVKTYFKAWIEEAERKVVSSPTDEPINISVKP